MVVSRAGSRKEWADRINRGLLGDSGARIGLRLPLPFLWLAGLLSAALLLPDRVWTTLLIGLSTLILVAFFWARSLARGLSADRRLASAGSPSVIAWKNNSRSPTCR